MNLSASKNISLTFQGYVEEWNSKFPHFKLSIPCLVSTLICFIIHLLSRDFIILAFTAHTAKEFSLEKKSTERFPICIVISQSLFGHFNSFYQQNQIFSYELMQIMGLTTSRQLFLLCGTSVKSRAQWKQGRTLTMECPFLKRGSVAV